VETSVNGEEDWNVSRQQTPAKCVGCGLRFREAALDAEGLCPLCLDEDDLENFPDLDDAELDDDEGGTAA
jgi:hypothetical protein